MQHCIKILRRVKRLIRPGITACSAEATDFTVHSQLLSCPAQEGQRVLLSHVSEGIVPGRWTKRSRQDDFLECRPSMLLGYAR